MIDLAPVALPETTAVGWRLLDAAAELFYNRGINSTGTDALVEQADTTKRTMYQRFGSKETLVCAYLTVRAHRWQHRVLSNVRAAGLDPGESGGEGTPQESLRVVFDSAVDWARGNPRGCAFVNAWAEVGDTSPVAAGIIAEEKLWMRRLFTALAGDEEVGTEIHGTYEGAVVCSTILREPEALERAYATAVTVLEKA